MIDLKKRDILYYARIIPETGIYEVCEIIVRTVGDGWFAGIDKRDKRTYLFHDKDVNRVVFRGRVTALNEVRKAELNKPIINEEVYYEEY